MKKQRTNKTYIIAGYPSWSREIFRKKISKYPGKWHLIFKSEDLTEKRIKKINPRFIFFLHWSWKVPKDIVNDYECVCFHMTDLPYGRGGSPLQNLIIRGHKKTKLTALKMVEDFDAGPIYFKKTMSLEGRAEEIYKRASNLAADMILKIITKRPESRPQKGKVVIFKRRKPEESEIPERKTPKELFDFIRMLDAEGYPRAFINYKGFIFEFLEPKLITKKTGKEISANVTIKKR